MDRQELSGGVWDSAYEYFGAHPCDGGWVFRVWAPQARCVALCGDFNEWQRWDMRRLADGAWELTVENARQFDAYQYVVTQCDGRRYGSPIPTASIRRPGPLPTASCTTSAAIPGTTRNGGSGGRAPTPPRAL